MKTNKLELEKEIKDLKEKIHFFNFNLKACRKLLKAAEKELNNDNSRTQR